MPTELQKQTYKTIMSLYDSADEIVNVAESLDKEVVPIIDNVEALVENIEENIEILMDNFLKYMKSGKPLSGVEKMKMEKAKKEINNSVNKFLNN